MIPESTIEEIRTRLSIVDVIGDRIALKKAGTRYIGLCPFHKEKTPSFSVDPVKQFFFCFGCNTGGNVFSFLVRYEGISFPEAVKKLASQAGVEIKEETQRRAVPQARRSPDELQALEWASKYFSFLLSKKNKQAADYLQKRGITRKTIERFSIGVAPAGWSTLHDLMIKRGFKRDTLERAGLILASQKKPGSYYDRFRERLMFPIRDGEGTIVGFGARILTAATDQPKYINSVESDLFSKRRLLYGAYENQRAIRTRGEAIIVEGYMDVCGLHEKGVDNAVATMGTALTEDHCLTLRSLCPKVVTVFDADNAGQQAWHRSVEILLRGGLLAKDLTLPNGLDPDEYVLKYGADAFYALCEQAPRQLTKLLKEMAAHGPVTEEKKVEYLETLAPILWATKNKPERTTLWDSISLVLGVQIETLKEIANQPGRSTRKLEANTASAPHAPKSAPRADSKPAPRRRLGLEGEFLLSALVRVDDFRASPASDWKAGVRNPQISEYLLKLHADTRSASELASAWLSNEKDLQLQQLFAKYLAIEVEAEQKKGVGEMFETALQRLNSRCKELEIKSLLTQIRLAQQLGDEKEQLRLLDQMRELRRPSSSTDAGDSY